MKKYIKISLLLVLLLTLFFALIPWKGTSSVEKGCAFCDEAILQKQACYEDGLVLVLYTHKPILPAHFLIIPKRHVERFEMLSEEEFSHIAKVIGKVQKAVEKEFKMTSYLLHQKNGKEVGQSVPHLHFHFIARPTGEASVSKFLIQALIAQGKGPIKSEEMKEIVDKMRLALQ